MDVDFELDVGKTGKTGQQKRRPHVVTEEVDSDMESNISDDEVPVIGEEQAEPDQTVQPAPQQSLAAR